MPRPRKVLKGGLEHKKDCPCPYCTIIIWKSRLSSTEQHPKEHLKPEIYVSQYSGPSFKGESK